MWRVAALCVVGLALCEAFALTPPIPKFTHHSSPRGAGHYIRHVDEPATFVRLNESVHPSKNYNFLVKDISGEDRDPNLGPSHSLTNVRRNTSLEVSHLFASRVLGHQIGQTKLAPEGNRVPFSGFNKEIEYCFDISCWRLPDILRPYKKLYIASVQYIVLYFRNIEVGPHLRLADLFRDVDGRTCFHPRLPDQVNTNQTEGDAYHGHPAHYTRPERHRALAVQVVFFALVFAGGLVYFIRAIRAGLAGKTGTFDRDLILGVFGIVCGFVGSLITQLTIF